MGHGVGCMVSAMHRCQLATLARNNSAVYKCSHYYKGSYMHAYSVYIYVYIATACKLITTCRHMHAVTKDIYACVVEVYSYIPSCMYACSYSYVVVLVMMML